MRRDPSACFAFDTEGHATLTAAGRSFRAGHFETPSIAEVRERARLARDRKTSASPVLRLHVIDGASAGTDIGARCRPLAFLPGSLFQVASQFNWLESPWAADRTGLRLFRRPKARSAGVDLRVPGNVAPPLRRSRQRYDALRPTQRRGADQFARVCVFARRGRSALRVLDAGLHSEAWRLCARPRRPVRRCPDRRSRRHRRCLRALTGRSAPVTAKERLLDPAHVRLRSIARGRPLLSRAPVRPRDAGDHPAASARGVRGHAPRGGVSRKVIRRAHADRRWRLR